MDLLRQYLSSESPAPNLFSVKTMCGLLSLYVCLRFTLYMCMHYVHTCELVFWQIGTHGTGPLTPVLRLPLSALNDK